jgi:hypothetical protein
MDGIKPWVVADGHISQVEYLKEKKKNAGSVNTTGMD